MVYLGKTRKQREKERRLKMKNINQAEATKFDISQEEIKIHTLSGDIQVRDPRKLWNLNLRRQVVTELDLVTISFPRPVPLALIYKVIRDGEIREFLDKKD